MITGRLEGGISMKYKILIIGEDYSNVNDIYDQFGKIYEVLISSPIAADISAHVNYFRPDMIMLSLEGIHDYVVDEFKAAKAAYSNLQGIPFATAGNKDDLMWFEQQWAGLADLKIDIDKKMLDIQLEVDVKIDKAAKKNAKALALGPQGYLLKPIDKEKLFAMIHKCIG